MHTVSRPVYVPADLLVALGEHTGHFWSDPRMEPFVHEAIRAWMQPAPAAAAPPQPEAASRHGYQWKQLFLPEGTQLRTTFQRRHEYALVQGEEIQCAGQAVSPSGFANRRGCGNRNAWQAVWLRFPGSEQWLLADTCRARQQAAIARLFAAQAAEPGAADTPTPPAPPAAPQRPATPPPAVQHKEKPRKKGGGHGKRHKRRAP